MNMAVVRHLESVNAEEVVVCVLVASGRKLQREISAVMTISSTSLCGKMDGRIMTGQYHVGAMGSADMEPEEGKSRARVPQVNVVVVQVEVGK